MRTNDQQLEDKFNYLTLTPELFDLEFTQSLDYLGQLIDISLDLKRIEGLEYANDWAKHLSSKQLSSTNIALLKYFESNIWANIGYIKKWTFEERRNRGEGVSNFIEWIWEQEEIEKQLFCLRSAMMEPGFKALPDTRKCQILTNLANLYNTVGRFVEAIEYWERTLALIPDFELSRGNMGIGITRYSQSLYDPSHQVIFLSTALDCMKSALEGSMHESARIVFEAKQLEISSMLKPRVQIPPLDSDEYFLNKDQEEIAYRNWCLSHKLFLNPLNDIVTQPVAAHDVLTAPSIVYAIDDAPYYHGLYNQIKQEFVSARYIFYEGYTAYLNAQTHFSDREVLLYNTLDYTHYSLALEKIKVAFRMAYSLLDKMAFLLNDYLGLGIKEHMVSFKTIWYENRNRTKLRTKFHEYRNLPMRGLFWLSKDLFEDRNGFRNSIAPDARDIARIRNHLEHKYLKLHTEMLNDNDPLFSDPLAFSIQRDAFIAKSLRMLKTARAALIYLSLAIHREEYLRQQGVDKDLVINQHLIIFDDEHKR